MPNINSLQIDDCAFVFMDHQPYVAFPVRSIEAKAGKALGIPTVLTTIGAKGGARIDPLLQQLQAVHPDIEPIDRHNTNAIAARLCRRVEGNGANTSRRLRAVDGGLPRSERAFHAEGWLRRVLRGRLLGWRERGGARGGQAPHARSGAVPMTWLAVLSELVRDFTAPEFQALLAPIAEHGQALAFNVQYTMAQYTAGARA